MKPTEIRAYYRIFKILIKKGANEYEIMWEHLKNIHTNSNGETYTKETTETPQEFINIINVLTSLTDIYIEICGSWLWITGNTKEHKEVLKNLNSDMLIKNSLGIITQSRTEKRASEN